MRIETLAIVLLTLPLSALAQAPDDEEELAQRQQSPVTQVMNVQVQANVDGGVGPADEYTNLVRFTPLLPVQLAKRWSLVVWTVVPYRSIPGAAGAERVSGVGDTRVRLLLTPTETGKLRWGLGTVHSLPTASKNALGAGKLSVGPAGALSYRTSGLSLTLFADHLQSVAGETARPTFHQTVVLPGISYAVAEGLVFGANAESTIHWGAPKGDRWSVPLRLTLSKVTLVSGTAFNLLLGGGPYLVAPEGGPAWIVTMAWAMLFPLDVAGEGQDR